MDCFVNLNAGLKTTVFKSGKNGKRNPGLTFVTVNYTQIK